MANIKLFESWLASQVNEQAPAPAQGAPAPTSTAKPAEGGLGIIEDGIDQEIGQNGGAGKPFASKQKPSTILTMSLYNDDITVEAYSIPADPAMEVKVSSKSYDVIGDLQRKSPTKLLAKGFSVGYGHPTEDGIGVQIPMKKDMDPTTSYKNVADCYAMLKGRMARDTWAKVTAEDWLNLVNQVQPGSGEKLAKAFAENKLGKSTDGGQYQADYDKAFAALGEAAKKMAPAAPQQPAPTPTTQA